MRVAKETTKKRNGTAVLKSNPFVATSAGVAIESPTKTVLSCLLSLDDRWGML